MSKDSLVRWSKHKEAEFLVFSAGATLDNLLEFAATDSRFSEKASLPELEAVIDTALNTFSGVLINGGIVGRKSGKVIETDPVQLLELATKAQTNLAWYKIIMDTRHQFHRFGIEFIPTDFGFRHNEQIAIVKDSTLQYFGTKGMHIGIMDYKERELRPVPNFSYSAEGFLKGLMTPSNLKGIMAPNTLSSLILHKIAREKGPEVPSNYRVRQF